MSREPFSYLYLKKQVFVSKLHFCREGDYNRYLAEFQSNEHRKAAAEASLVAYKKATEIAQEGLATTHPIRLGKF